MIYGITVVGITIDVFGFINLTSDYKNLLSYCFTLFVSIHFGRFFDSHFSKIFVKNESWENNAVILGLNKEDYLFIKVYKINLFMA